MRMDIASVEADSASQTLLYIETLGRMKYMLK